MESFKHSCPFCGQHIEYTAGYCGRQMTCPICGNVITFPAVPPNAGGLALKIRRAADKPAAKWAWDPRSMFVFLRQYPHWKTVALCLVPFVVVGGLLEGAAYVKKNYSDEQAPVPVAEDVNTDTNAWGRMTTLAPVEQALDRQVKLVNEARAILERAEQNIAAVRQSLPGTTNPPAVRNAAAATQIAQKRYSAAMQDFEAVYRKYQQLGGAADYRSRLQN
jgi:hypothetical protein